MSCQKLLVFFMLVAGVYGQSNSTFHGHYLHHNMSLLRADNYIDLNRRQFADYILEYDRQLDTFRQHYNDRLSTINLQMDMLVDALLKTDERLNPLEVLSDISKDCVQKYRSKIPTVAATKVNIQACINAATGQIPNLVSNPETTKRNLQNYYTNTFEKELKNCEKRFPTMDSNYTQCATTVIENSKITTTTNQKAFLVQIDASQCSGTANIKRALDCSFSHHNKTIAMVTEANLMINKCLQGQDDCERCSTGHFCDSVYYLPQHHVTFDNATIINPFYGRNITSNCLMLEIY